MWVARGMDIVSNSLLTACFSSGKCLIGPGREETPKTHSRFLFSHVWAYENYMYMFDRPNIPMAGTNPQRYEYPHDLKYEGYREFETRDREARNRRA